MKQFATWFTHGVPGGAALRKSIYMAKSSEAVLGVVEEFFENREAHAESPEDSVPVEMTTCEPALQD
jgi:hypothetical protein